MLEKKKSHLNFCSVKPHWKPHSLLPNHPSIQPEPGCGQRGRVSTCPAQRQWTNTAPRFSPVGDPSVFRSAVEHKEALTWLVLFAPEFCAGKSYSGWTRGSWVCSYRDWVLRRALPTETPSPHQLQHQRQQQHLHGASAVSPMRSECFPGHSPPPPQIRRERQRERETGREREADRVRQRQRERQKERDTVRDTHRERDRDRQRVCVCVSYTK